MASTQDSKKVARIITVFFLVIVSVIGWFVAPFILPVWRWQHVKWEDLSVSHQATVEELQHVHSFTLRYNPRAKGDPLPWQVIVKRPEETPKWSVDPDGNPVDEYQTLVRVELLNDRTGLPPGEMFLGGTKWDKYFRVKGWRFKAGSINQSKHTRPVILYQGGSFEKMPLAEAKSYGPWLQQEIRQGGYIEDDNINLDYFPWRTDPFGERLLFGPTEEELKAEEEAAKAAQAEEAAAE